MATVTIASSALSPSTKTIKCQRVNIGHKRMIISDPNANNTDVVEVQAQSYENPTYNVQGIMFTGETGTLTYADCVTLTKLPFDGTNAPVLTITYNAADTAGNYTTGTAVVSDSAGSTSGISVVVESFNSVFDAQDSKDAYRPSGTLSFRETG